MLNPRNLASRARATTGYEHLYTLAFCGVFIGFIPIFAYILPAKINAVMGPSGSHFLGKIACLGALVAGFSNIAFGMLSDRTYREHGSRKRWVTIGLIGMVLAAFSINRAGTASGIAYATIGFQITLNMVLAPMVAIMADLVPDERKGTICGRLAVGQSAATLIGFLVSLLPGSIDRYLAIPVLSAITILPFLLAHRPAKVPMVKVDLSLEFPARTMRRSLTMLWFARFAVQTAGTVVSTFLFFFVAQRGIPNPFRNLDVLVASFVAIGALIALPCSAGAGWLSDWLGDRQPFLLWACVLMAAGLTWMGQASESLQLAAGYWLFLAADSVFSSLHIAYTAQVLPSPLHRGRDLALFNLTSTIPGAIGPLVAMATMGDSLNFAHVWHLSAALCILGGVTLLGVRRSGRSW